MLRDKSIAIQIALEVGGSARCHSAGHDLTEIGIRGRRADAKLPFDLKTQPPTNTRIIEFNDKIVHRMTVPRLLHGHPLHDPALACGMLLAQQSGKIICDDGVLVRETRAACQLG